MVNVRANWLVSAMCALSMCALSMIPSPVVAQDGWTVRWAAEAGAFTSTRDLGKNTGGVQELNVLQVSSRMDRAMVYGGGLELVTPDGRTMIRGLFRSTVKGSASGRIALCKVLEGALCIPRQVDARMASFLGEVVFLQGSPEDLLRQNFVLGAGLRSYQFRVPGCDLAGTNPDLFTICELVTQIYEDQAQVQPFLEFGFGFSHDAGPVSAYVRVHSVVGPYGGGAGNSDGDYQGDVFLMGGLSFRVR